MKFFLLIILFLLFFSFSCGINSSNFVISEVSSFKSFSKVNVINLRGISLSLPEDWDFTFNSDNDIITTFNAMDGAIVGQLALYSSYNEGYNFKELFLDYLSEKPHISIDWIYSYGGGFVARGVFSKYETYLRANISYIVYLSLSVLGDKVYEISVLGSTSDGFEDEALFLIDSLSASSFSENIFVRRYSLGVEVSSNWLSQATADNQLVNLRHNKKDAFLIIYSLSASNLSLDNFVLKELEEFNSYLRAEQGLTYYYDIKDAPILSKSSSKLLQFFGELGSDDIEIKRHYFRHKDQFCLIELWYRNEDLPALEEDFKSVIDNIKFY